MKDSRILDILTKGKRIVKCPRCKNIRLITSKRNYISCSLCNNLKVHMIDIKREEKLKEKDKNGN